MCQVVVCDAHAGIPHVDRHVSARGRDRDGDFAAVIVELDAVGDEILQHLSDAHRVGPDQRQVVRGGMLQAHALLLRQSFAAFERGHDQLFQGERLMVEFLLAAVQARQLEQALDQILQAFDVGYDPVHAAIAIRVGHLAVAQGEGFDIAPQRRHRRAQIVGDPGEQQGPVG